MTHTVPTGLSRTGMDAGSLRQAVEDHLLYSLGRPAALLTTQNIPDGNWPAN